MASGSWWWTGRPGVLRFMGSQRVGHDWVTELNWSVTWEIITEIVILSWVTCILLSGNIDKTIKKIGVGYGTPLQYSCLENSMDRGAWWAIVHGVAKSWTQLSDWAHRETRDSMPDAQYWFSFQIYYCVYYIFRQLQLSLKTLLTTSCLSRTFLYIVWPSVGVGRGLHWVWSLSCLRAQREGYPFR